jgi:hypothetical protein
MKQLVSYLSAFILVFSSAFAQSTQGTSNAINLGSLLEEAFKKKEAAKVVTMPVAATTTVAMPAITGVPVEMISDVDINIPETGIVNENAFAIIIGNANYTGTANVDYAINDARAMEMYVKKTLGFIDENVFLIEDATGRDFNQWFGNERDHRGRLFNLVYANDETITDVFIFYAGHGAPDVNTSTGYFLPTDCDPNYISITAYSGELLFNNLSKIGAKSTTVVMDACFSGNGVITGLSAVAIKPKSFGAIPNGVIISSSSGTEPSAWYEDQNHGLFTYYFLKAIQDKETSDTNMDGLLSVEEIYKYTANKVTRKARGIRNLDQHPTIQGDNRDRVLVSFE